MTMDSPTTYEKKATASPPIAVQTTRIREKTSDDSIGSNTLSPASVDGRTQANGGFSGVSTPTSATANPFETDIEAMAMHPTDTREQHLHQQQTRQGLIRSSTNLARGDGNNEDCQPWPGRGHWMKKHKMAKRKNASCNCLSALSPRNRLIVKILIGLLVVAIGVGVGLGVSRSLGASIWKPGNQN